SWQASFWSCSRRGSFCTSSRGVVPSGPPSWAPGEGSLSLSPPRMPPRRRHNRRLVAWRRALGPVWRRLCAPTNHWPPPPRPAPAGRGRRGGWGRRGGAAVSIPLPDGRRLVARLPPRQRPSALVLAAFLGAIALVVALGARPVARRLTGRLERLQRGVESLGA